MFRPFGRRIACVNPGGAPDSPWRGGRDGRGGQKRWGGRDRRRASSSTRQPSRLAAPRRPGRTEGATQRGRHRHCGSRSSYALAVITSAVVAFRLKNYCESNINGGVELADDTGKRSLDVARRVSDPCGLATESLGSLNAYSILRPVGNRFYGGRGGRNRVKFSQGGFWVWCAWGRRGSFGGA